MFRSVFPVLAASAWAMTACGDYAGTAAQQAQGPPATAVPAFTTACAADDAAAHYPDDDWLQGDAAQAGWSADGLQRAMERARAGNWFAGMVVQDGRVLAQFGDVAAAHDSRSIRKSILGAVIGQLVAEQRLSLDATLAEMGIDDSPPLTEQERGATLRHLLQSRSGVYREAAFMTPDDREDMPAPGTHAPGEAYWYNNWGFNALGTVVRNAAGELSAVIDARIGRPLGMQDFSTADVRERFEAVSQHSAYRIWMSTRDRARFGYLYLRHGCWRGRQIVPAEWVAESLYPHTNRRDSDDFGYLWRSQEGIPRIGMMQRFYAARGNALQYIMLIPEWDAVLVLTTDMDHPGWVNWLRGRSDGLPEIEDVSAVLEALSQARAPRS